MTNPELREEIVSRISNNTAIRKAIDMTNRNDVAIQKQAIQEYEAIMRFILSELEQ